MTIQPYTSSNHDACTGIFNSNCPAFFDPSELELLRRWLGGLDRGMNPYGNSEQNVFFVGMLENKVIACGGFYVVRSKPEVRLAWGMVHRTFHRKGYGRNLLNYRLDHIRKNFPEHSILLDTSQHTMDFFQKQGFALLKETKDGYGPGLHRMDMIRRNGNTA